MTVQNYDSSAKPSESQIDEKERKDSYIDYEVGNENWDSHKLLHRNLNKNGKVASNWHRSRVLRYVEGWRSYQCAGKSFEICAQIQKGWRQMKQTLKKKAEILNLCAQ